MSGTCTTIDWPAGQGVYFRPVPQPVGAPTATWVGSLVVNGADGTGLLYRRNRYYDPASGRFTQEDPIGLAGGLNLYGFAGGDPVNFSDPFGLCPTDLDAANAFLCNSIEAVGTGIGFLTGFVAGGGTGALETVGSGGVLAPLAVAQTVAASGIGAAAGLSAAQRLTSVLFSSSEPHRSSGKSRTSANQMRKQIERGQAPKSATRVDVGKVAGEQDHIHFGDEDALNADGTWKHGGRSLTNAESDWLLKNG